MQKLLTQNGWIHYSTGCPCEGLPRYYRHDCFPDYKITLRQGKATLKKNGTEIFNTTNSNELINKLNQYGINTKNQD